MFQSNEPGPASEKPLLEPPVHLLRVPGQRSHHQSAAAMHSTFVATQQAAGPKGQLQICLHRLQP